MKRVLFCLLIGFQAFSSCAQNTAVDRPKLVVGIVVDQMRWDYLYRFYERFGNNGFKRMLNDGFSCENTFINYLPAYTAPGHASIYTGSVPSIHGISGNDWIDNLSGRHWYCSEDTTVTPVGGSIASGRMSPRNLLSSTITDELRLATNFRSRVFGFSIKDRGAIIPAGHLANGAFWFDDSTGNFMSSSFYMNALPEWLQRFNAKRLPDSMLAAGWQLLAPANTYRQSLHDNNPYEGKFPGTKDPVFPHYFSVKKGYSTFRRIPAGNTYTLLAARACIAGEQLGRRGATDFLCISLSSTDYIGHQFTPNSVEVEDTYMRLDADLAALFAYLEKELGKGNYLTFLTADHGGAHNANYLRDLKLPAGNVNETQLASELKEHFEKEFKSEQLVRGVENYQVVLHEEGIKAAGLSVSVIRQSICRWLYKRPEVAYVVDMDDLNATPVPEPIRTMAINGYNRLRSGSLLIVFNPGWYFGYSQTGTTHSTWHPYDTHIPLLWYGWKIPKGRAHRTVYMQDIAPTIAALLRIQMPNGSIGNVITELTKP